MQWKIEVGYKPTATDAMGEGIKKDIEDLGISGVDYVKTMQVYMIDGDISESDVEVICENLLADRITQTYRYISSPPLRKPVSSLSLGKQESPLTPLYEKGGEEILYERREEGILDKRVGEGIPDEREEEGIPDEREGERVLDKKGEEEVFIKGSLAGQDGAGTWVVEVAYKPGVTDPVGDSTVKGIKDLGISGVNSAKTGQKYIIKGSLSEDDIEVICKRLLANDVIQNYTYERTHPEHCQGL